MAGVHNPYHFVPLAHSGSHEHDVSWQEGVKEPAGALSHAQFHAGHHSGALICKVHALSSCFVGGRDRVEGSKPSEKAGIGRCAEHAPFAIDGRPALPASSMKGMLASMVEAISDSSLRVLAPSRDSLRTPLAQALSAIGRAVRVEDAWYLQPLCLPSLRGHRSGMEWILDDSGEARQWECIFGGKAPLKVLRSGKVDCDSGTSQELRVPHTEWTRVGRDMAIRIAGGTFKIKQTPRGDLLLGAYDSPKGENASGYARRLRGSAEQLQRVKYTHLLRSPSQRILLRIPPDVLQHFVELCKQQQSIGASEDVSARPLVPMGRKPFDGNLIDGDLLCFSPRSTVEHSGPAGLGDWSLCKEYEVGRIAFSSLWRSSVADMEGRWLDRTGWFGYRATVDGSDEVSDSIRLRYLPLHPAREELTLAEQLFGCVDRMDMPGPSCEAPARRFRGRVRISDALPLDDSGASDTHIGQAEAAVLRVLATPKPPCPAMYLRWVDGRSTCVRKADILAVKAGTIEAQGRKMYLHNKEVTGFATGSRDPESAPWISRWIRQGGQANPAPKPHLHVKVQPIPRGSTFRFRLDFENLTDLQLGLLLRAIDPVGRQIHAPEGSSPEEPADLCFVHKIGMGKALGLGSVEISIDGFERVDRGARYSPEGLLSARCAVSWARPKEERARTVAPWPKEWKSAVGAFDTAFPPGSRHRQVLSVLGDPRKVATDVWTPLASNKFPGTAEAEQETFKWFTTKDVTEGRQGLTPLDRTNGGIPILPKLDVDEKGGGRAPRGGPRP